MRWHDKPLKPCHKCRAVNLARVRGGFLWWPVKLKGETRWLERATWLEVCTTRSKFWSLRECRRYVKQEWYGEE